MFHKSEHALCRPSGACSAIPVVGIIPTFSPDFLASAFSFLSNRNIRRRWRVFCRQPPSEARRMKKRKPRLIQDKKKRGEWAESVFMARAGEHGLPVSRPWGEMSSYDFVIGKTGRFVSVQVKSTISKLKTGYVCTVRGGHKAYAAGS